MTKLGENEDRYRRIVDTARDGIWVLGPDMLTTFVNARMAELLGYAKDEFIGRPVTDFMFPEDAPAQRQRMQSRKLGQPEDYELRLRRKDGQPLWALISATPVVDEHGRFEGTFGMVTDVTERRRMEQALRRSEQRYRTLVENMPDLIVRYDVALRRILVNPAWEKASGLSANEVVNMPADAIPRVPQPTNERYMAALRQVLATAAPQAVEFSWVNARGVELHLQYIVVPEYDQDGKVIGLLSVGRDISDLKTVEEELRRRESHMRRLNRVLSTLSNGNQALVRAVSEQELLDRMCRVVVETGGHTLAWIGCVEPDGQRVALRAWAGTGNRRLWPSATQADCGAVATVLREGHVIVTHDIASDAGYAACREQVLASGCRSALTLPVRSGEQVLGVLCIYSADSAAFDTDEVELLTELANDLGYGIGTLRARRDQEESQRRLQSSMEATIQALASVVELRDPYTAGHQRRVAQLAVAIAREMKLADDRVHGLYLAAVCHDIGKVQVPAEILSKPGRLTRIEYDLIKGHVDAGYEILRFVDFPWPIAQIVRQHHERLDGSGYPLGISGQALLLESRILAVADVVEAIMAHRPYRAGFGIELALDEIRTKRGTLFDADAVDACVCLFSERGFHFE